MIDWNKLQPYKSTKNKSFEQLCYQIATKVYQKEGRFTSIDDGDGVEFYLTLPNGDEYGWQCKYYEDSPRLKIGGRKEAIKSSLKKSIKEHPHLRKWFLCLTTDLTTDERQWFDSKLSGLIPKDKDITLELWGESHIHDILNGTKFNGLRQAFFNE